MPGDTKIVLESDWIAACSATLCNGRAEPKDPTTSTIASLPAGHDWSPNGSVVTHPSAILLTNLRFLTDTHTLYVNSIGVNFISSEPAGHSQTRRATLYPSSLDNFYYSLSFPDNARWYFTQDWARSEVVCFTESNSHHRWGIAGVVYLK